MAYFSWEHPLISGGMDLIMSSDFGSATVCTIAVKGLKAGTLLLEALYSPALQAPPWLQLPRYLPAQSFRLVVDHQQRNLTASVAHKKLNQLAQGIKKTVMPALLREVRPSLTAMLPNVEALAQAAAKEWISTALDNYGKDRSAERQRLQALMNRNPHISPAELESFDAETLLGKDALAAMQLNMSALRLAIVSQ
jgi:ATP-dependent helicase HepA